MKNIIIFFSKLLQKEMPKPIGRWKIENCNTKINNKIDLSNEDHCGPCGQYAKTKIDLQDNKVYDKPINDNNNKNM
jgi:hypothetical protein